MLVDFRGDTFSTGTALGKRQETTTTSWVVLEVNDKGCIVLVSLEDLPTDRHGHQQHDSSNGSVNNQVETQTHNYETSRLCKSLHLLMVKNRPKSKPSW